MSNQEDVQAAVRLVTGTSHAYNRDWMGLWDLLGVGGVTWNERMLTWLNTQLGASYTNINDAMTAYAVSRGYVNWSAMSQPLLLQVPTADGYYPDLFFDFNSGAAFTADYRSYWPLADGIPPNLFIDGNTGELYTGDGTLSGTITTVDSILTCTRALAAYGRNSSGSYVSYGTNTLRYDYSGGTRRLLVEEARTNSLRNNTMAPNTPSTGTGTAAPTNWTIGATLDGLTRTIQNVNVTSGVDCIDIRYNGNTTTGGVAGLLFFDTSSGITAGAGESWTVSAFLAVPSGTLNFSNVRFALRSYSDAVGSVINTQTATDITLASITSTLTRFTATFTTPALTVRIAPILSLVSPAGAGTASDVTLRIGWPQCELGSFATSPIPTSSAAVTRPADVVSMTLPTALQGLNTYTLFSKGAPGSPTSNAANQVVSTISDGTANNRMQPFRAASTGGYTVNITAAGGTLMSPAVSGTWAQDTSGSIAIAQAAADQAAYRNSATSIATTSVAGTLSGVNKLNVGSRYDGTLSFNGGIEQIALWGSRRTNTALGTLTT